uniref:Uncharacterized protein n=1 Tax=Anoplophora glabripennis TaxID=217634 RepID=V5FZL8_ANOGL
MSDHRMIAFEMESDLEMLTLRRNPRATNWEVYRSNLGNSLEVSNQGERITSTRQLDNEVETLSSCIVSAYEEACPLRAAGGRKVRWWNKTLEGLRQTARRVFNRAVREGEGTSWDDYKTARREFKKELRRSKRSGWKAYCSELESLPEELKKFLK